ncbi:hypothetical protein [Lolliginicoccus levis]|uniref:hypothetical protein n=1 Tax=Lolliginicoccus levis TaxID=2919542 RepID=UPI00241E79BF|nr:hypothetical protein [Lolliginicoccus levis]
MKIRTTDRLPGAVCAGLAGLLLVTGCAEKQKLAEPIFDHKCFSLISSSAALTHNLVGYLEDTEGLDQFNGDFASYLDESGKLLPLEEALVRNNHPQGGSRGYAKVDETMAHYLTSVGFRDRPLQYGFYEAMQETRDREQLLTDDYLLYAIAEIDEAHRAARPETSAALLPDSPILDPFRDEDGLIPYEDALALVKPTDDPAIGHAALTRILTEYFVTHDIPVDVVIDTYRDVTSDCIVERVAE